MDSGFSQEVKAASHLLLASATRVVFYDVNSSQEVGIDRPL